MLISYVFPFSFFPCYHTIVLREQEQQHRKKALKMLKEFYESFSHREGK